MDTKEQPVAVKKVVIQLGKKELVLGIEEAKQLQTALNDMFGKVVTEEHHHHHDKWWPYYWDFYKPYWQTSQGNGYKYIPNDNTIYCSVNCNTTAQDTKQLPLLKMEVTG
jgi:hypothetical protein